MRFVRTGIIVTLLAMGACGPAPRTESALSHPGGGRLILPDAADARQSGSLLDLVRRRLPVVVQSGRFVIDGSITPVCVHARRSGRAVGMSARSAGPPACPMIDAFVDGVRIGDIGSFLARVQASDFQSIEFVSTSSAGRDVATGGPGEALILWTRGRGPYSASGRRQVRARRPS